MSLDTTAYEADLKTEVEKICPRVFVTDIPDGTPTPAVPYVVLHWTEPVRASQGHHLDNSRHDTQRGGLVVEVFSETDDSANQVKNALKDALTGYRMPDCDELLPEGGFSSGGVLQYPRPSLYRRGLMFSFFTNMSW